MRAKTLLLILGLLITTNLLSQNPVPNIIMNSTPAPGVYEAYESITLQPGFSFSASSGNSLTLKIVPDPCNTGDPGQDFVCRMNHITNLKNKIL